MSEITMTESPFHPVIRITAKIISYIFHPLFIPVYMGGFFVYVLRLFPDKDDWGKSLILIQFFVSYTLLPLVSILLAKGLGFVQSLYLKDQKDRIIPYVISGIFYFWIWYVSKNLHYPPAAIMFSLAVFLTSSAGLIANIYFRVSMHGLSMGVVLALMLILAFGVSTSFGFYLAMAFLVAGLVCTSRLVNADHSVFEVYAGVFIGVVMQLIAWAFV